MSKLGIITCTIRFSCYNKRERVDRMKRLLAFFGILCFLFPFPTKAILCSNEDKVKFQTLASNITTSYTYTEENANVTFQITLSNIYEGLIIKDVTNRKVYPYKANEIVISDLKANTSYRFDVYTNDIFCDSELLYSHYVNTPPYNPYYQDELCKGLENHSICQKWANITYSYEEFQQRIEALNKQEEKPVVEPEEVYVKNAYDYILEFYLRYYYIMLPIFIVMGIIIICRYHKRNKLF